VNGRWERECRRKLSRINLRYYPGISVDVLTKIADNPDRSTYLPTFENGT
jgi:hypothetical protein